MHVIRNNVAVVKLSVIHTMHIGMVRARKKNGMKMNVLDQIGMCVTAPNANAMKHHNVQCNWPLNCRRPDGRFSDTASVVSNAVLNHYASYHRRPVNRVSQTQPLKCKGNKKSFFIVFLYSNISELKFAISNTVPGQGIGLSELRSGWACRTMSNRWASGRMT